MKILDLKNLPILLAFICLFFSQKTFSQKRDSVRIKSPIFSIIYSEKLEQPIWIEYKVACPDGKASRAGMDFFKVDSVHTSDHFDYVNNIYDKGHLAPAASFNCTREMLLQTFSYLNCALQDQRLNRGIWKMLEIEERKLAASQEVRVVIEILFDPSPTVLPTGASVPKAFRKTLFLGPSGKKMVYLFPNVAPEKGSFADYLIRN